MSVAVLLEQEVVFKKGFGYADVEKQIPATPATSYHIASLTKPFSAAIVMTLVENGKLKLDDGHVPKVCSSLILKLPERQLTMILLANSDGASKNFNLGKGDVLNSPFARLFIESFTDIGQTVR
jgi:CubicO group peptidase (beta-lactamase class C family)